MSKLRYLSGLMLLLLGSVILVSCNNDDDDDQMQPDPNMIEFLSTNSDYALLHEALVEAGLDVALSGPGPFTLFAPDDAAFQDLLNNLGVGSISEIDDDVLVSVLLYHVLGKRVIASDVTTGYDSSLSPSAQAGEPLLTLYFNTDSGVKVNEVDVVDADIEVSNGVIHGIDEVLLPANITDFVFWDPNYETLLDAIEGAGDLGDDLLEIIQGGGPYTIFAPDNDAFQALLDSNDDWDSLDDIDEVTLATVLSYHVVSGNVRSSDLSDGQVVPTLLPGASFTVDLSGTVPMLIDGAGNTVNIGQLDVQATNGVGHGIDGVLLPGI